MEYQYKTVVIGAGPAGSACAISMQKAGESLCLIDRAVFPRSKTCAGLVTAKTYRLIRSLFTESLSDDLFCDAVSVVRLFRKTKELASADLERPVRLVNRIDFDNALVEEYKRLGGVMFEGEKHTAIDYERRLVTLSNGDTIRYQTLMFADGSLSMAHKLLDFDKSKLAFGVEAYVPADRLRVNSIDLYFDYLPDGYAWVFPHGDTVCIGLANQFSPRTDYLKTLNTFLDDLSVDARDTKIIGAFLPYGYAVPQDRLPDNVMLLGDAGGFTDPISGDGLYMALQTGIYAAQAALSDDPKQAYLKSVQELTQIVTDGKKVQKTFYSPAIQKLFYHKAKGKSRLVSYFFENMVEEYRYDYRDIYKMYRDYKKKK